jgi:shikimate dehydrogenase
VAEPPRLGRAAVLGHPIAHSLSPVLHRAAYAELGLDWSYEAIDCRDDQLATVLAERPDWAGFSCTMPLKHVALELAADADPPAVRVGAANTLLPRGGGGWSAANTDVDGVLGALTHARLSWSAVTVLGAGGTAQAVVAALASTGLPTADILVRDVSRTAALQETAARCGMRLSVGSLDSAAAALRADLVVSTLPPRAADAIAGACGRPGQVVLDVVYDPWPTAFAAAASAGGAQVLSGALMLLHQAARQVELMTGRTAPVDAMRRALRRRVPQAGL